MNTAKRPDEPIDLVAEEQSFLDQAWDALEDAIRRHEERYGDGESDRFRGATADPYADETARRMFAHALKSMKDVTDELVIGRVNLSPTDEGEDDDYSEYHLGALDLGTLQGRIVDWRSPYGEAFYSRSTPDRRKVLSRRTIEVEKRVVVSVEADTFIKQTKPPQVDFGRVVAKPTKNATSPAKPGAKRSGPDGATRVGGVSSPGEIRGRDILLDELESARDGQMRKAVATIQADQDRAIRSPRDRAFIIEGGPGTGKTVVGLHRIAKILYDLRAAGEETSVLVVGPNKRFIEYISRVLPSLGERSVNTLSFRELCESSLPPKSTIPVTSGDELDPRVARVKGDIAICGLIRVAAWAKHLPPNGLSLRVNGSLIQFSQLEITRILRDARDVFVQDESSYEITRQFAARRLELASLEKVREVQERATQATKDEGKRAPRQSGTAPAVKTDDGASDGLTQSPVDSQRDPRQGPVFTIGSDRGQLSYAAVIRKWLPDIQPVKLITELLTSSTLADAVHESPAALVLRHLITRPASAPWTTSDLPLLDEAVHVLGGDARRFRHVVVDEAQDLSPMAWRVVARRVQGNSLTILGDPNQRTSPAAVPSWAEALSSLRIEEADILTLGLSYRLPAPVLDYAKHALPAPDRKRLPRGLRQGDAPKVVTVRTAPTPDDVGKLLGDTLEDEYACVITIDPKLSALEKIWPATVVLHPDEVKGLEFDVAIVVDPGTWCAEEDNDYRRLFIALTRPTKKLIVLHHHPLPKRIAPGGA